jgi:hypothetical protein
MIETATYNFGGVYVTNKKIMIVVVSFPDAGALHQFVQPLQVGHGHARHGLRLTWSCR